MPRRAKPPFPINLIWNVKAFYVVFIVVMIASLGATGLAVGLGGTRSGSGGVPIEDDDDVAPVETPVNLVTYEAPVKTIDASVPHEAVIATDRGDIVIALNPDTPEAANSFAFLAGENFYDGLEFFWVQPEFDVLVGDPTCESSGEFACTGFGGPGYDLPMEGDSSDVSRWAVVAPVTTPGGERVHGSQFVIALADGETFEGSVLGQVVEGQDILESLQQREPCFASEPSESNPCDTEEALAGIQTLTIEDVVVRPA